MSDLNKLKSEVATIRRQAGFEDDEKSKLEDERDRFGALYASLLPVEWDVIVENYLYSGDDRKMDWVVAHRAEAKWGAEDAHDYECLCVGGEDVLQEIWRSKKAIPPTRTEPTTPQKGYVIWGTDSSNYSHPYWHEAGAKWADYGPSSSAPKALHNHSNEITIDPIN